MRRPARVIAAAICAVAALCVLAVLALVAFIAASCGYLDNGNTISGPSHWYNYSSGNASYVVLDLHCGTLGQNAINVLPAGDTDNISIEAVHAGAIDTKPSTEHYGDILHVDILTSYHSDIYLGGARINVYLPAGPAYDIMIDSARSTIYVGNFSGTNLVVRNGDSGNLMIDGGAYDYVYVDNGGNVSGRFRANGSQLRSANGRVNIATPAP